MITFQKETKTLTINSSSLYNNYYWYGRIYIGDNDQATVIIADDDRKLCLMITQNNQDSYIVCTIIYNYIIQF